MLYNKHLIKTTAKTMLIVMVFQLAFPVLSHALTSGPSQPEVQGFEPVGTTDMVDLFTGDFVYNIPLLDIEGYPINISYHGSGDMEQEASWVGLGWNINPGVINRSVRGLPDDIKGEMITKTLNMKDDDNIRVGLGVGAELAGVGSPMINLSLDLSSNLNISSYRGVSADFSLNAGVNVLGMASAGINMGVGSQSGADVGYNLGMSFSSSMIVSTDIAGGVGFNLSQGYSTRSGLKDRSFGVSMSGSIKGASVARAGFSSSVPIGLNNIVPVITNKTTMNVYRGQLKFGGELVTVFAHAAVYGMFSRLHYEPNGSMKGYGYLYADEADDASIMDFTRDRDGLFNETMPFLPLGNMTYDIYSVSGQGTGGSFRPFRNDFGSVYDPAVSSKGSEYSFNLEVGLGNLLEAGGDGTMSHTKITSGPWEKYKRAFSKNKPGSVYENTYFKQAGEATSVNEQYLNALQGITPINGSNTTNLPMTKPGSDMHRDPRGNLMYYFTGTEASKYGVASSTQIKSYNSTNGFASGPDIPISSYARDGGSRKGSQISEIVQVQTNGTKYIFGLPAMNTSQKEVTFASSAKADSTGLVSYTGTDTSVGNNNGTDHFFSSTETPSYAHSFLLTSVLPVDYVDVTGDGPSDDDFGSFTKFNYSLKDGNFNWKAPFGNNVAQLNEGFKSDPMDNKASFLSGTREQWYLHSVETKNFVAEFYTSKRKDGQGSGSGDSYKLDSISLFNKHDRFLNKTAAIPIKTVIFKYSNDLCMGIPNTLPLGGGKLKLVKIFIRNGKTDKGLLSPYQFEYSGNFKYNPASKDRWGTYKPNVKTLPNWDFPFVNQDDPLLDSYAGAWSLSKITLPSGGNINIEYEADDYGYVQDKAAMEMSMLMGLGSTKNYGTGGNLYANKDNPNLYFYFKRRIASENQNLSFSDNYFKGQDVLYYNFNTRLTENAYEPIKGFATIVEKGICPNNSQYGYVKVKGVVPEGGGAVINPVSYTAINFARYYLPQVIFPGNNPYSSSVSNVLAGLKYAFSELLSFAQNPIKRMVKEGKANEVKLASSFIRLVSPGLKKKGGGQRVRTLSFSDNWATLAGGSEQTAQYGKRYDYTTDAPWGGKISSGVASYEPQIGGDENPFRLPVDYSVQNGSSWPPNDPVGVYQELPIGESLYPAPVVGYGRVTVTSIHQGEGRSSQGLDIYDFYTAKDFPIRTQATALQTLENTKHYTFKEQKRFYKASQGYTLIFNDMHGKQKRVEHRVIKPTTGASELVSYQQYIYNTEGNKLSNKVPVIEYDAVQDKMKKLEKTVAYEADITIDTREKREATKSNTLYVNLNVFVIGIIPIPFPFGYTYEFNMENQFNAVVATKVIQQYGILKEIQSSQEGALTTVRNIAFDPVTGQALITSVNNEFGDKEYSVNYPAYWGYKTMGPSFENTGYTEKFTTVPISNYEARLSPGGNIKNYRIGDELLMEYNVGSTKYANNVWVTGFSVPDTNAPCNGNIPTVPPPLDTVTISSTYTGYGQVILKPRYKYQGAAWPATGNLANVSVKVVRSGAKNQLTESIQSYTGMEIPFDDQQNLKESLQQLISISAKEYSDTLTAILPQYDPLLHPTTYDSLNEFVNGRRQVNRVYKEYAYMTKRAYDNTGSARKAGLFSALALWRNGPPLYSENYYCWIKHPTVDNRTRVVHYVNGYPGITRLLSSYLVPKPLDDRNWVVARTVTKYSPWGFELENKDAIGNYTTAQYGYNNQLPVALAQNARQHEIFAENFEDYKLLQVKNSRSMMVFEPFMKYFPPSPVSNAYQNYSNTGTGYAITNAAAHTGNYCLDNQSGSINFGVVATLPPDGVQPRYAPFQLQNGKTYIVSMWFRPKTVTNNPNSYVIPALYQAKSNIIEGWQQIERKVVVPASGSSFTLSLPSGFYIDDIRMYPVDANMKAFVYHPFNQKLTATLDENNFATFYEYDQEGNLIRTKKETEKGIMTIMESRSANPKR